MIDESRVARHYARDGLLEAIEAGLAATGKTIETATIDDLGPVDEFHIGGREATQDLFEQVQADLGDKVLDIGCGIGGPARVGAEIYGWQVTGIDLTREYIDTGRALTAWVGLSGKVSHRQGSALDMPFDAGAFDAAYMIHVGMNIADKARLMAEAARVLKPGATLAIYDVMRMSDAPLEFPVPWATMPEGSALDAPGVYRDALVAAGFEITAKRSRREFGIEFFKRMRAAMEAAGGPPPLGLRLVMGEDAAKKLFNLVNGLVSGAVAPVEIVAQRGR